jgi:hypothetical protein
MPAQVLWLRAPRRDSHTRSPRRYNGGLAEMAATNNKGSSIKAAMAGSEMSAVGAIAVVLLCVSAFRVARAPSMLRHGWRSDCR